MTRKPPGAAVLVEEPIRVEGGRLGGVKPQSVPFREVVHLGRLDPAPNAETQIRLTEAQALAWGRSSSRTLTLASDDGPAASAGFKVEAVHGVEDGVWVLVTNPATETGLQADNDAKLILEG